MKFMQGMIVGGIVGTGITLMYTNNCSLNSSKKMIRKGKQFIKKLGML